MKDLTTAERILFETIIKPEFNSHDVNLTETEFKEIVSNEFHPGHLLTKAILKSMETYGELKWNEACNTLRPLEVNPMIMNDFFVHHINPEFKP